MNEQQLAAVKQALYGLTMLVNIEEAEPWQVELFDKTITALQSSISQDALHKMAEESRTSGLRLDDWDKIGCVNHDCDKCKAVQEPLHDEKVRLIAHNECPEDWDSLDNKECWLKGFVIGFKTAAGESKA
jgi:hypothetical protein